MNIQCLSNKWFVESVFSLEELRKNAPLVAMIAEHDLTHEFHSCARNAKVLFVIIEQSLYAVSKSDAHGRWFYFDHSVRRFAECDQPTNLKQFLYPTIFT